MKNIASILLLGLLLFNWCGYRWVINIMQQKADLQLEASLDRNEYDESQLIEIKVPVDMPYQTDWANFERCDGEIEVNGIHYKYVKRKVQDGQLVLKCIPNRTRQKLESAKDNIFKITNDLQQDNAAKKSGAPATSPIKSTLGEYDDLQQTYLLSWNSAQGQRQYDLYQPAIATDLLRSTPERPPNA